LGLERTPSTLWANAALTLADSLVANAIHGFARPWWWPAFFVAGLLLSYGLLRGFRVVWWLTVISIAIALGTAPFEGIDWWSIPVDVGSLALVLAPSSRRFVFRTRPGKVRAGSAQTSWDPESAPDADRPSGWYVYPDDPRRMRYWNDRLGEWQGNTKTPRKIRDGVGEVRPAAGTGPPQETWDARHNSDADRPRGWYVDTDAPLRMRYWAGPNSGWTGATRTPSKIRQAWEESPGPRQEPEPGT
jgi:hypothetical protein